MKQQRLPEMAGATVLSRIHLSVEKNETIQMNTLTKKLSILGLIAALFLNVGNLSAQWYGNIGYSSAYSDNPFGNPVSQESWINTYNGSLEKSFSKFSLGYFGSYAQFTNIAERNYYWHQLALWQAWEQTDWGATVEQHLGREEYSYLNYNLAQIYLNHRFETGAFRWAFSIRGIMNNYREYSDYDYFKGTVNLRLHRTISITRTTLIGRVGFDYKTFLHPVTLEGDNSGSTMMGGGSRQWSTTDNSKTAVYPNASQLNGTLRIGQSITPVTGLALQYSYRYALKGSETYLNDYTYLASQESNIYDDPINYEGGSYGGEITQLLPFGITVKGAYYIAEKQYTAPGIYTIDGTYEESVFRKDQRRSAFINLWKAVQYNLGGEQTIRFNLTWQWIGNDSNSYWYDYEIQSLSLGAELQF